MVVAFLGPVNLKEGGGGIEEEGRGRSRRGEERGRRERG